jgi:hypothetical protein
MIIRSQKMKPMLMAHSPKDWYVYVLYRPNGVPFYVGKGSGRRLAHSAKHSPTNIHKRNIIANIHAGGGTVEKRKIATFLAEEDALAFEQKLIREFGRTSDGGLLCNLSEGGEGGATGCVRSDETKEKMRQAALRRYASAEERLKMSEVTTKAFADPAVREQRSTAMRGKKKSPAHIAKLKKRVFTPKWRAAISAAKQGQLKGVRHSPDRLARHREAAKSRKRDPITGKFT